MTVPIIFLPGIMGSRLELPGSINWDPDSPITSMLAWASRDIRLKYRDLGVSFRPSAAPMQSFSSKARGDVSGDATLQAIAAAAHASPEALYTVRGWAGVAWSFYGAGLMQMEITLNGASLGTPTPMPNPVYAFAYDWRQPNQLSGQRLAAFVDQVLARESASHVALVTHSMGGLAARAATLVAGLPAKITGVVHSAQPSIGAVVAYRRFQTGCFSPLDGTGLTAFVLQCITGRTNTDYAVLAAGVPSVSELMPNATFGQLNGAAWLVTAPPTDQATVSATYKVAMPPGIVPPELGGTMSVFLFAGPFIAGELLGRVDSASRFHTTLAADGYSKTFVLSGDGLSTDQTVDFSSGSLVVAQPTTGDATVPGVSGSCAGLQAAGLVVDSFTVHGVEHSQMFKNAGHNSKLLDFISKLI